MSLYNMVCNKPRPCYVCLETISLISGDKFNIGWEYPIDYVEKRMSVLPNKKIVIETKFKKLTD